MRKLIYYPTLRGDRTIIRGGAEKTKCIIRLVDCSIGTIGDKPRKLELYEKIPSTPAGRERIEDL